MQHISRFNCELSKCCYTPFYVYPYAPITASFAHCATLRSLRHGSRLAVIVATVWATGLRSSRCSDNRRYRWHVSFRLQVVSVYGSMLDQLGEMNSPWSELVAVDDAGIRRLLQTHHSKISSLSLSSDDITVSLKK